MGLKHVTSEGLKDVCILMADDDEGMRDMLSLLLSRSGYRVILAENGRQAFELFSGDTVSLVITDRCMPEMDGLTLAAMVKVASPNTPVIMITGTPVEEGVETGCVDRIILKPFQLDDINKSVEMALDGTIFQPRTEQGVEIQIQG